MCNSVCTVMDFSPASSTHHMPAPAARLHGQLELRAAASRKAVWWDLRLASLLTHLFVCLFVCLSARQFLTD